MRLIVLVVMFLAGCADVGDVIVTGISPPPSRYMGRLKRCPGPPENTKVNETAKQHMVVLTKACASNKRNARGLQRYARALTGKKK